MLQTLAVVNDSHASKLITGFNFIDVSRICILGSDSDCASKSYAVFNGNSASKLIPVLNCLCVSNLSDLVNTSHEPYSES